eukprot:scaffold16890_cov110-Isochrysis_galbana.AAC.2
MSRLAQLDLRTARATSSTFSDVCQARLSLRVRSNAELYIRWRSVCICVSSACNVAFTLARFVRYGGGGGGAGLPGSSGGSGGASGESIRAGGGESTPGE